jgi:hypothetical protein
MPFHHSIDPALITGSDTCEHINRVPRTRYQSARAICSQHLRLTRPHHGLVQRPDNTVWAAPAQAISGYAEVDDARSPAK